MVGYDFTQDGIAGGERRWALSTIANAVSGIMSTELSNKFAKWKVMSTTYTAIDGDRIAANTSGGAFTITLPASPVTGNCVNFADAADSWDTNNLTIARNTGQTIEGLAQNLTCDVVGDMVISLIYNGSTWRVYV